MTKIAGINLLSTYCVTALCWATMLFLIIYMSPFGFLDFYTNNSYIINLQLYYLKCSSAHLFHMVPKTFPHWRGWKRGLPLVFVVLSIWPCRKAPNSYQVRDLR